ncbi:hypothetical protein NK8_43760 [Caballeronia sp. NK8]|nr:hypothetical protein NK8_43760 [Caballeronia sp. NK8]
MHLNGRNTHALELERVGGAGIVNHGGLEAEVVRRARDGVDAHMAHSPDDHDLPDALSIENLAKIRLAKGIHVVFHDDPLAV